MFQHPRKLIRHAAAAQLMGLTATGTRVFRTRFLPMMPVELPALNVYTLNTGTRDGSEVSAPRILEHEVELIVEGMFRVESFEAPTISNQCDDLAFDVERAMAIDCTIGGTCSDSWLQSTSPIDIVETLDAAYACIRWNFVAYYERAYPHENDLPSIDDFLTADIAYRPNAAIAGDQANDVVNLPGP